MFLKRPGGQSQFSRHLAAQQRDDVFGTLELWMLEHLDADLSVETLARRARQACRAFERLYRQPAHAPRLQAAAGGHAGGISLTLPLAHRIPPCPSTSVS
jgi:transcriptional regulator GlxA family with amidase domain